MTRDSFMEKFRVDDLEREDKNLLFRTLPEIFMDRIDYYMKKDKPVELIYFLHDNYVFMSEREQMKLIQSGKTCPPILKDPVKLMFKNVLKTKQIEPAFLKVVFRVVEKFADQLLVACSYGSDMYTQMGYRPNDGNVDFEFQAIITTKANLEVRYWVELGNLEYADGREKLERFDAAHFHSCLKIIEKFTNLLEFVEECEDEFQTDEEGRQVKSENSISEQNLEILMKADEFATKTMLSLVQHLIEVNVRGDPENLKIKDKQVNELISEAGRSKAGQASPVSIFSTFKEEQLELIFRTISYFYSLNIHIKNSINLTPEFPTWLTRCIELVKLTPEISNQKVKNVVISTFSPVMFKLLIMAEEIGNAILDESFFTYLKEDFLPTVKHMDQSIHSQFVEVLVEMGSGFE